MTQSYRIRTEDTWTQARDAYLAGEAAESVCERFDLGLSNFRKRARQEGWRRLDQDDPAPLDIIDEEDDLTDFDEGEALDLARRKMLNAAGRGRVDEAMRWGRFLEMLERLEDVARRRNAADEAVRAAAAFRRMALARMHDVHQVHPAPRVETPPPAPASPPAPQPAAPAPTPPPAPRPPSDAALKSLAPSQPARVADTHLRTRSSSSASPAAMAAASGNRTTPLSGAGQVASPP